MAAGFKKVGERVVYDGPWLKVGMGEFEAPDGHRFERDIVHHPGAVAVVPVVDEGEGVLLVRQYRSALDLELLEIPAGKRDKADEPPMETARRELVEEVGMRAGRMEQLAECFTTPGWCDERLWLYMALDLEDVGLDLQGIEEQHMTIERISLDAVPELIASGYITDMKTQLGLSLARTALQS